MSALQITFLGTGTSVGVPMIGCQCRTCTSEDPRDQRCRSSVLIESKEGTWLIDTGPDLRQQCLRADVRHLDAVFLTHSHYDHVAGFDELRRFTLEEDATIPVYARASTLEAVSEMFRYAFNGQNRYRGYLKPEGFVVEDSVTLGSIKAVPVPVQHGKVETIGWCFEQEGKRLFGYVPDCKIMSPESIELLRGVDTLVLDGLRYESHPTHQSFDEAIALAGAIGARECWLTHFNCDVLHSEALARSPKGVAPAHDGLQLEVGR